MKYKVGDKVKIRSLEWYNENKDGDGEAVAGNQSFVEEMKEYCGMQATITSTSKYCYSIDLDNEEWSWTDEMFEEPSNCAIGINRPSCVLKVNTNMEQEKTFKPFEKVLVRNSDEEVWCPAFYCYYDKKRNSHSTSQGICSVARIIPFADNEHLVGTTDMPEEEIRLEENSICVFSNNKHELESGFGTMARFRRLDGGHFPLKDAFCIYYANNSESHYYYCIPISKFYPKDTEFTKKEILTVKNGKIVKANI